MHIPEETADYQARVKAAIDELKTTILEHYPEATFEVAPGNDESDFDAIHIWTTVDLDDPDEVFDLVVDRVLELQYEDDLPIHVIPITTPERNQAEIRRQREAREQRLREAS